MPDPSFSFWITLIILGMTICLIVVQGRAIDRLTRLERKTDALLRHAGIDSSAPLERKTDTLLRHAGIDSSAPLEREVLDLMQNGRKIEAIKLYRERTGVRLAEAKERVESLARNA